MYFQLLLTTILKTYSDVLRNGDSLFLPRCWLCGPVNTLILKTTVRCGALVLVAAHLTVSVRCKRLETEQQGWVCGLGLRAGFAGWVCGIVRLCVE